MILTFVNTKNVPFSLSKLDRLPNQGFKIMAKKLPPSKQNKARSNESEDSGLYSAFEVNPRGTISNLKFVEIIKILEPVCLEDLKSGIFVTLPFYINDQVLPNPVQMKDGTRVLIKTVHRGNFKICDEINTRLGKTVFSLPKSLEPHYLEPDHFGYSCWTQLHIFLEGLIDVDTQESGEIVEKFLPTINQFITLYIYLTKEYTTPYMLKSEIQAFQVFDYYLRDGKIVKFPKATYVLPSSSLKLRSNTTQEQKNVYESTIKNFSRLSAYYSNALFLHMQAMKELEAENLPSSAILGMISLEVVFPHFVRESIKIKKDTFGKKRLSLTAYDESRREISVSFLMKSILPLLVPDDIPYPSEHIDACNSLRKRRNNAIHQPENFSGSKDQIRCELNSVDFMIDFLQSIHPQVD